ncbi:MAG: C40 family peptidase, partial [Mycobacterium sp.]|nr:C40 family peptidase [Mycobacterium sp.]
MGSGLRGTRCAERTYTRFAVAGIAALISLSGVFSADVLADPANDATAKLSELSRQAEQTTEAMHSAELDLNNKLAAQRAADKKHADDQAALGAAKAKLANFQSAVNKFAAAMYMGGRTDGMHAILSAGSPQQLIGKLAVQRAISTDMSTQMARYRAASQQTTTAEQASAKSAADARTAAEQAAAVRADLQSKQSQLQLQIAVVKSQYLALTPGQRTALAAPGPIPAPALGEAPQAAPPGPFPLPWALPDAAPGTSEGATAVEAALTQIGSPYVWGGAAPGGFDCSGLVMWAFQQAGIA